MAHSERMGIPLRRQRLEKELSVHYTNEARLPFAIYFVSRSCPL